MILFETTAAIRSAYFNVWQQGNQQYASVPHLTFSSAFGAQHGARPFSSRVVYRIRVKLKHEPSPVIIRRMLGEVPA